MREGGREGGRERERERDTHTHTHTYIHIEAFLTIFYLCFSDDNIALKFLRNKLKDIQPQSSLKGMPDSVFHNLLFILHTNEGFGKQVSHFAVKK
jgi:hypothetical protein